MLPLRGSQSGGVCAWPICVLAVASPLTQVSFIRGEDTQLGGMREKVMVDVRYREGCRHIWIGAHAHPSQNGLAKHTVKNVVTLGRHE